MKHTFNLIGQKNVFFFSRIEPLRMPFSITILTLLLLLANIVLLLSNNKFHFILTPLLYGIIFNNYYFDYYEHILFVIFYQILELSLKYKAHLHTFLH